MKYIIKGKPSGTFFNSEVKTNKSIFNTCQHDTVKAKISIEGQHDERPYYRGPLHLDAVFYFAESHHPNHKSYRYHLENPRLTQLLLFIEECAAKILYDSPAAIISMSAKKLYSDEPRTEFTLKELDNG